MPAIKMTHVFRRLLPAAVAGLVPALVVSETAFAQAVGPDTIAPRSLAPTAPQRDLNVDIPQGGALQPPKGAEALAADIGSVEVVGGFDEVKEATAAVIDRLRNGRHTLAEVYAAASEIEAIHAKAGFVLARISVPPQKLNASATLRFVLTDGFIESVDVSSLPARVREPVRRRTAMLERRGHLRMRDIEQALVIANDVPGLTLRSTLARGREEGGARLILEGSQNPVSMAVGFNNGYDGSLGTYALSAEVSLNSLLGRGETIYGYVAGQYDLGQFMSELSPAAIVGGGVVLRPGNGRWTINPEFAISRTRPTPSPGAPQTVGKLRRLSLRAEYVLRRTRFESGAAYLAVEQIDQTNDAPDFFVRLSHDRFMAARLGFNWSHRADGGRMSWSGSIRLSHGLGSIGAITQGDAIASGIFFSRLGATPSFTNLVLSGSIAQPSGAISVGLQARLQSSFGQPQFRAEQFSLEGADGLSAYVGGLTTVDEGVVSRVTISLRNPLPVSRHGPYLQPYVFTAAGIGRIDRPTIIEPDSIRAIVAGAGVSVMFDSPRVQANIEYARGVSSYAPLDRIDRVSFALSLRI